RRAYAIRIASAACSSCCACFLASPSPFSLSSFFFCCSRHPRDLRSFPTRRSSDLAGSALGAGDARRGGVGASHQRRPTAHSQCGDRKSTRLNSSHQIISYAVFCLKKKMNRLLQHKLELERHDRTIERNTHVLYVVH